MSAIFVFILRLLLIILAYLFLGWLIYMIFSDLKNGKTKGKEKIIPPIILNAQIRDETITKRFRQPEVFLGRDPSTDLTLNDETISLRHCKLTYHNSHWWLEDLDSTNGTYLNNSPITMATILTNGDKFRLGKGEITFNMDQNIVLE